MRVSLTFLFGSPETGQIVEFDSILKIEVQDYVFNRQLAPEPALVVISAGVGNPGTAYELDMISDIRLAVHEEE